MKTAGVLLLAFLVIYKDMNGKPFQISWWGILGLIGWTYAVCAGIYLFTRENLRKNAIAWFVVVLLAVVSHSDLIPRVRQPDCPASLYPERLDAACPWYVRRTDLPAHAALCRPGTAGTVHRHALCPRHRNACPALVSHPFWIISKIQATPTWLFYCLAMFFPCSASSTG